MIPPIYGSMAEEIGTRMIDQWMTWDDRFPNGINKKNNAKYPAESLNLSLPPCPNTPNPPQHPSKKGHNP
jgi:hypothetical protein